jgi:putative endonuclease
VDNHPDGPAGGATRRPTARARLGAAGERLAARLLEERGVRVLCLNWHCAYGEIDVIAEDGPELVFVEVKTRRGERVGSPEEAITPAKRRRLIAAAQTYLAEREEEHRPYRIDVVAVDLAPDGSIRNVRLHRRAIEEG